MPEFAHTENYVMRGLLPYLTPERDRWLSFQLLTESRFPIVEARALFYCIGKICKYGMKEARLLVLSSPFQVFPNLFS